MRKCKYAKKSYSKGHVICDMDGSRRNSPCYCPFYEDTLWTKIKCWFSKYFC